MKKKRPACLAGATILTGTLLGGTAIALAQDNGSASTTTAQEEMPSTTDDEAKSDSSRREHGDRRGGCGEGDRSGERSGEHSDGDSGSADNTSTSATA